MSSTTNGAPVRRFGGGGETGRIRSRPTVLIPPGHCPHRRAADRWQHGERTHHSVAWVIACGGESENTQIARGAGRRDHATAAPGGGRCTRAMYTAAGTGGRPKRRTRISKHTHRTEARAGGTSVAGDPPSLAVMHIPCIHAVARVIGSFGVVAWQSIFFPGPRNPRTHPTTPFGRQPARALKIGQGARQN